MARFHSSSSAIRPIPAAGRYPLSWQIFIRMSFFALLSAGLFPSLTIAAPLPPASLASSASQPVQPKTIELNATDQLPEDDLPEEVLRTEIFTEARSPIDGKPMTAQEYAELLVEIDQANQVDPQVSPKVRQTVSLLKLRKFLKTVLPILPIK